MIRGGLTALLVTYTVLLPSSPTGESNTGGGQQTKITLLGTLGSRHLETLSYPPELLRDILVRCKPDIILVALPVNAEDEITAISVESVRRTRSHDPEVDVAADAAHQVGAQLVCFDIPEREEYLRQYQERRDRTDQKMSEWMLWMTQHEAVSAVDLGIVRLASYLAKSLTFYDAPRTVNFAGFDALTRQKYFLYHELIPQILNKYDGFKPLAADWEQLAHAWTSRNAAMAQNIGKAAQAYAGKRLVVVVDAERRYALRDLLERQTGISLAEYWEIGANGAEHMDIGCKRDEAGANSRDIMSRLGATTMETEEFQKAMDVSVPAIASGTFSLENFNGSIQVKVEEPEKSSVNVVICARAVTHERAQELVESTRIESQDEPGKVSIKVVRPDMKHNENLTTDFEITLPRQVAVQLATCNGNIALSGVRGRQQCRTQNGDIECNIISSWTELTTQNGSINLKCPTPLAEPSQVKATTSNGGVSLEGVQNLSGTIEAEVFNGTITCQSPITIDEISKTRLRGRVGQAEGRVLLQTANGAVVIR